MASATEPGLIRITVERSGLGEKVLLQARSDGPINAGGSPDGALANKTADKQLFIPYSGPVMKGGDIIHLYFKFDSADGLDASDCTIMVPIWEDGVFRQLNASDFGFSTDVPASTPAGYWVELGTGYTIPSNVSQARFGNGHIVVAIEDDTA